MAKDPVCGMEVDEKKPAATTEYNGQAYYFCSAHCISGDQPFAAGRSNRVFEQHFFRRPFASATLDRCISRSAEG